MQRRVFRLWEWRAAAPWFLFLWAGVVPLLLFPQRWPAMTGLAALLLVGTYVLLRERPPAALDLALLIYLCLSAVALLAAPVPAENLRRLTTLLLGMMGYLGLFSWLVVQNQRSTVTTAVRALPLLGAGLALMGLVTADWPARYLLDLQFLTARLPHIGGGFSINHNQLAGALIVLLLPAIFSWRELSSRKERWGSGVAILLMLLVLLLTQSRNGLLSLLMGLVAGLLWQRGRFRLLVVLVALLLLLPLLLGVLPDGVREPLILSLDRIDGGSKSGPGAEQSWLARFEMWSAANRLMREYPIVGVGLYEFERASRSNEVYQAVRPSVSFSHAHNLLLQTGTGLGWPGWLAAALLWIVALYHLARATIAAPQTARWAGVALGAALCAYLTFNTFDVLALEQRGGLLVWLYLALVAAFVHAHAPMETQKGWRWLHLTPLLLLLLLLPWLPRNLAHLQLDRARLAGTPEALPALSAVANDDYRRRGLLYALQGREVAALAEWQRDPEGALYLAGQGLRTYFQESDSEAALVWYARALTLDPTAADVYYWQGQAYEELGRASAALDSYRRAVARGQGQMLSGHNLPALAWERQGRILVQQGEWQAAAAAFRAAVALAPDVADYQQQLAEVQQALIELEGEDRQGAGECG